MENAQNEKRHLLAAEKLTAFGRPYSPPYKPQTAHNYGYYEKIEYGYFSKMQIRVATILHAEKIEGSDKLLRLEISLGDEKRQLVAGIAPQYKPEEIVGKQIPVIANLEPRKIRGIESNGMILAADDNGKPVLLHPQKKVPDGAKVI